LTQIISWIFSRKTASTEEDGQISKVQVSFLEIYKEEIFDLLSSVVKRIEIKNDKGKVYLQYLNNTFNKIFN
jgi:hypothetical protein